jgi:hypothetical protein
VTGPNARFREWINGDWVVLTLSPGQCLEWSTGGATDEGWSFTGKSWRLLDGEIHHSTIDDGSDCDGRLTRYHDRYARVEDIDARKDPSWYGIEDSQDDANAIAAGY